GSFTITPIDDPYVTRSFPGYSFFAVIFRQWPVAVLAPPDLSPSNVYTVTGGVANPLRTPDELLVFYVNILGPVGLDADTAQDAARSWLRMSEEFSQDMFFTFTDPVVAYDPDNIIAYGNIQVASGGQGGLEAALYFDAGGGLVNVTESRRIIPGIRPICQATKLLDRHPLVRPMGEPDLLGMGSSAQGSLMVH